MACYTSLQLFLYDCYVLSPETDPASYGPVAVVAALQSSYPGMSLSCMGMSAQSSLGSKSISL